MQLRSLSLAGFKNYSEITLDLHPKLNCFVGDNGVGKTNLLDSVYYLCMCKSYFNSSENFTLKEGHDYMILQAKFDRLDKGEELYRGLQRGRKKVFRRNNKEYGRLSDHIGLFPIVMVSPSDIQLITEGSEERRKYVNRVISQYDKTYLEHTIQYNHILAQRNKLLKDSRNSGTVSDLLDVIDYQLVEAGNPIYEKRRDFIFRFMPVFNHYYHGISGGHEEIKLIYRSQLNDGNFLELLSAAHQKDRQVQFSTTGIHKDDLVLNLGGRSIKYIGSQGQQKTFLVALKFAEFEFLREVKGFPPLLLLDDVFDKLDAGRVRNILRLVQDESFGQIFITHTSLDSMKAILRELRIEHTLFRVADGHLEKIPDK